MINAQPNSAVRAEGALSYEQFLASKRHTFEPSGFNVTDAALNRQLFGFQRDIVRWALHRGKAAVFAECGMGKTPIQLSWAERVADHTSRPVLIFAPLAVSQQTVREGEKFHIPVNICRTAEDVRGGINVTNYEMLHHFTPQTFSGLVLDESSCLKSYDSVYRKRLTDFGRAIPYRLACTATPAPNDLTELTNHAEFLEVMSGKEILALYFIQDGNSTHKWRLKGHAKDDFWRWMAQWSVALRKPSDLGYPDDGFILPPLNIHHLRVNGRPLKGMLFATEGLTLEERRKARQDSLPERVAACAEMVNASSERWLVWCNLNAESAALAKAICDAVEVRGSDPPERKEKALLDFTNGQVRVMVTKPTIAGHGMNWQHCAHTAFVGLSDSWEEWYQAIRRCWRFGQTRPVECYVITADTEGAVVKNIERKEAQAAEMMDSIVGHTAFLSLGKAERDEMDYRSETVAGNGWTLHLGDCIEMLKKVAPSSVGLSVFSPPFPGMYAYTNSVRDMGNVKDITEMIDQFRFLIPELLRVTMPGRSCCIHLTQAVAFKGTDGYIGIKDFRGRVIDAMEQGGWVYYGEVCIDKNPQVKAIRTRDSGLQFKSLATDSARMHMALADYLLQFRKPGDNPAPIRAGISKKYDNPDGWLTPEEWIEWAAPVWYGAFRGLPGGIRETDVLNVEQAKDSDDQKHLCALQLGVIERAIKLWSAPGDLVCDPFAGIGSSGYEALRLGRRFVGVELKRSYFETALHNLREAERQEGTLGLFAWANGQLPDAEVLS